MTRPESFFATAPGGLEGLLAAELADAGAVGVAEKRGGVAFGGGLAVAYRACLWSRVANRVLLPLATFDVADGDALYAGAREVDWPALMVPGATIAVDFGGQRPAIGHTHYGSQRVKDAIVDACRAVDGQRPDVDVRGAAFRVNAHQIGAAVTLALDLGGESLHRRGYRQPGVAATLKENLAAAMLLRGDWPAIAAGGGGFVDPFCGSGTLPVEAGLMAAGIAPGLLRQRWGFQGWTGHDTGAWTAVLEEARAAAGRGGPLPSIAGFDRDGAALRTALAAVSAAGLEGRVHIERRELAAAAPLRRGEPAGLVATNPPYGERLEAEGTLVPLYQRIGERLRTAFPGWRALILNGAGVPVGLRPERSWQVRNGPIDCRLERFDVAAERESSGPAAPDLANRIARNQRRLKALLRREDVGAVRLYDADIPEYALAVDRYHTEEAGPWLHVQEYAPPRSIDAAAAQRRLRAALATLPEATGVAPTQVAFKVRQRQKGRSQYQRQGDAGVFFTVREQRVRVRVNFTDYLDTGLFPDHRVVREWIGANAQGVRFLNLFAYTAVATAHAVAGGARATTSVDLSRRYLDWARANLALNGGADTARHALVRADCLEWLRSQASDPGQRWDLILLDPPSFSNSSAMEETLDVQRDHAALIRSAAALLAPEGVLVFSTNRRRFRLEREALGELDVTDATRWSLPPDFRRGTPVHQCFFVRN